jgi:hypothetical protein
MLSVSANEDLKAFTRSMIDEYIRVPAAAFRKVDKNHLNLGMRWAWIASDDFYAGCKYSDVFSINCYQVSPDAKMCSTIYEKTGMPLMIGEFQIGALMSGCPQTDFRQLPIRMREVNFTVIIWRTVPRFLSLSALIIFSGPTSPH